MASLSLARLRQCVSREWFSPGIILLNGKPPLGCDRVILVGELSSWLRLSVDS